MTKWIEGKVIQIKHWTDRLFSLIVHAPISPFIAGQFTKLSLNINDEKIRRAYSYVNAPNNNNLEFYIVTVSKGKLSPLLQTLQSGDDLMLTKEASGFFVLDKVPSCENLWMLATGTALGPYLSILEQGDGLDRFNQIILVHATRFAHDLSYLPQMLALQDRYNCKLRIQTVISREQAPNSLTGRIPDLISNGLLESAVNITLNSKNSYVMLCGNPQMVRDTQKILKDKYGMCEQRLNEKTGRVISERYW